MGEKIFDAQRAPRSIVTKKKELAVPEVEDELFTID